MLNNSDSVHKIILNIIINGIYIIFEDRKKLGYQTYKSINHAESIDYINSADNDLWDIMVFGYKDQFKYNKKYFTKKILGVLLLPNNNHKIVVKLGNRGFSNKIFKTQLERYISEYSRINKLDINYVDLS